MFKVVDWIKNNKLVVVLFITLCYFFIKQSQPVTYPNKTFSSNYDSAYSTQVGSVISNLSTSSFVAPAPEVKKTTISQNASQNRMVVADSYLSLVVAKVEDTHQQILKKVEEFGGFMISSSVNNPQENANASLTVRIPSEKLEAALAYFKSLSIKVVTENLTGEDITNQYTDINARLKTLDKTKAIFEEMLNKATLVQDILDVQQQIIAVQDQIDVLKGQTKYLEESSSMAKITVYLSTDELSLPYAPLDSWRPEQIAKEAVRSLISMARGIIGLLIWIGVYGIIWMPVLIIIYFIKKKLIKKNK